MEIFYESSLRLEKNRTLDSYEGRFSFNMKCIKI